MLADKSVKGFLQETASDAPVPGGGSIAAMSGATAAALTSMVSNLTIGKKKYEAVEETMKEIRDRVDAAREQLIDLIDKDADSFNGVMACFKMPKETEEEKAARKEAIQQATKEAAQVPLEIAEKAMGLMKDIEVIVQSGNSNAVTDGAVAAMLARTAVLSALYNVKINLGGIKDETYVKEMAQKVSDLEEAAQVQEKKILEQVKLD
ncbi:cyclodeaminase/cyclohydrolase family protein [Tindallia californiensis]|uniref:Formimidoyltetrahydrofolate cyclodeaminase n=1 Tax=Tindallia californiensis TaxID=159292 RepID=A0A1H3MHL7_9FIRM|nr:cyclodeaminase/cyclohydrolase family protein [Tindallia californiensis]SDY76172.1 Formimidoyltetrahydrofolate cyclodeaminase [Tindallia californiensis]